MCKVYDETITAFSYADKKKNIKSFEDKIVAVRLVMFSKILLLSYDEEKKVFLPYCMLPDNKKRNIADDVGICLQIRFILGLLILLKSYFLSKIKKTKNKQKI